jgi:hypothetical protein
MGIRFISMFVWSDKCTSEFSWVGRERERRLDMEGAWIEALNIMTWRELDCFKAITSVLT